MAEGSIHTISDMDEPAALQQNKHWRMAVWSLRAGYVGLIVGIVGLVILLSGSTPWILAVGIIVWLAAAAVTVTGVIWARHDLPEPRPGLWPIRFILIHDTLRARPRDRS